MNAKILLVVFMITMFVTTEQIEGGRYLPTLLKRLWKPKLDKATRKAAGNYIAKKLENAAAPAEEESKRFDEFMDSLYY
uniref:Antimicrobial peptide n=1 Tax=Hadrurus spadix TaxID=141984 RepID=A0A1W7RB02_9SCOR